MRVVARQHQRLQGIVKPLRLAKLNAREDAAEQEDSQVGAQRDPSVGWDRALRPKGESSTTQRAGCSAVDSSKARWAFLPVQLEHPSQQRPAASWHGVQPPRSSRKLGSVPPAMTASERLSLPPVNEQGGAALNSQR